jgi:hypothetical protein
VNGKRQRAALVNTGTIMLQQIKGERALFILRTFLVQNNGQYFHKTTDHIILTGRCKFVRFYSSILNCQYFVILRVILEKIDWGIVLVFFCHNITLVI